MDESHLAKRLASRKQRILRYTNDYSQEELYEIRYNKMRHLLLGEAEGMAEEGQHAKHIVRGLNQTVHVMLGMRCNASLVVEKAHVKAYLDTIKDVEEAAKIVDRLANSDSTNPLV